MSESEPENEHPRMKTLFEFGRPRVATMAFEEYVVDGSVGRRSGFGGGKLYIIYVGKLMEVSYRNEDGGIEASSVHLVQDFLRAVPRVKELEDALKETLLALALEYERSRLDNPTVSGKTAV